jgi:hypothetical protein
MSVFDLFDPMLPANAFLDAVGIKTSEPAPDLPDWDPHTGSGWGEWQPLGGQLVGQPAVACRRVGIIDVFVRGKDNRLWQRSWNRDHWTDWARPPDSGDFELSSSPVADTMGPDHVHLFARGTDGQLWQKWWTTAHGWLAGWEPRGGQIIGEPGVRSRQPTVTDVFATGTDKRLWHRWFVAGKGWSAWQRHKLKPADPHEQEQFELQDDFELGSSPVADSMNADHAHVFVRAADGQLAKAWWTRELGWHGWEIVGGKLVGPPGAVSRQRTITDVFVRGTDNRLWQNSWDGDHWTGWAKHEDGFTLDSSAAVSTMHRDQVQVFARGTDGQLWGKRWRK